MMRFVCSQGTVGYGRQDYGCEKPARGVALQLDEHRFVDLEESTDSQWVPPLKPPRPGREQPGDPTAKSLSSRNGAKLIAVK
jgi:hypothetical protein